MSEPESTPEFGTLAQGAAAYGVSEKTLRKRIHAGEVSGEKVALEGGGIGWRVAMPTNAPEVAPEVGTERAGTVPVGKQGAPVVFDSVPEVAPVVTVPRAGSAPEPGRLEELRDEVKFLRAALEARDRDAAELRAALREALKISNRAIMPPMNESAQDARQDAQNIETGKEARPAASVAQSGTRREARPLWKVILGVR
jgi:hypothetical protein